MEAKPQVLVPVPLSQPAFVAFVGIDWADQKHQVCVRLEGAAKIESSSLQHTPQALDDWAQNLRSACGGGAVAVCLEQSRGPLIYALLKYEFMVIYPLPPARLAAYRTSVSASGAKDDPSDAALILDYLLHHRDRLCAWKPDDQATRRLALLVEQRRHLVDQGTALSNQLRARLKEYFPQALDCLAENLVSHMTIDFLLKWPDLASLQAARPDTVRRFYYAHHVRRADRIGQRLADIAAAKPLVTDLAIIEVGKLTVQSLVRMMRPLVEAIAAFDRQIREVFAGHPDARLFRSLPGAGPALAPRLLVALGTDRQRFADAARVQVYCGIAPITQRSGKSYQVHRRWACPKFLRQTFHEFAGCSLARSAWAKAYYDQQRQRGRGHHTALRALAFKWIRIIVACWKSNQPYDEAAYQARLQRQNSPLLARITPAI